MNLISRITLLLLLTGVLSCTPGRQITQITQQADEAYTNEDYQTSLALYESLIDKLRADGEFVGGKNYNRAGLSAWALGDTTKALEYLDAARHTEYATSQTFAALAQGYRSIDNLSREITSLEQYLERFPEADQATAFRERLFLTYIESMNWELALNLHETLDPQAVRKEKILEGWFLIHSNLDNEAIATKAAHELLEINSNNIHALQWLAEKHYWLAENRYKAETRAYEQNRTNRQYAKLLEAFEILNTDFRISLNYFLRLYPLNPTPSIARYIGNIYLRFDDKEKADHYHRLARQ